MQDEEKSRLEERIIAYFDGSLDDGESSSLLREVAENPEKRAIFKGHETLERLIAAAREPLEAPLAVKQSLADRIPGMIAFLPGLFGAAETAPIITQSTNPFLAFFTRMSLTTAVSIGGAVALLVTGIIVKNDFDNNSLKTAAPKIAAVSQQPENISSNNTVLGAEKPIVAKSNRTFGAHHLVSVNSSSEKFSNEAATPVPNNADEDNAPIASEQQPIPNGPVTRAAENIPTQSLQSIYALPVEASEGIAVKPYISGDERILSVNGIGANDRWVPTSGFLMGLDFDLGDRYVFHVQGGYNAFTTISRNQVGTFATVPEYKLISDSTYAWWMTVGLSYPIFSIGSTPIIASGDIGAVWLNSPGFMGRVGLSTEVPISSQFAIRPSVTYDEVLTSLPSQTGNLILENPVANSSVWSSAVGINIGLVLHY